MIFVGILFGHAVKGVPPGTLYQTRAFWSGLVIVFFFSSLAYYSYRIFPDWMFMYFVRSSDIPWGIVALIFLGYFLAYNFGFFLKFDLEKTGRRVPWVVGAIFLLLSGLIILPVRDRYLNVGTLEQYLAGQAIPLSDSPVGKLGMLMPVMAALGLGLFLWSRRQNRN